MWKNLPNSPGLVSCCKMSRTAQIKIPSSRNPNCFNWGCDLHMADEFLLWIPAMERETRSCWPYLRGQALAQYLYERNLICMFLLSAEIKDHLLSWIVRASVDLWNQFRELINHTINLVKVTLYVIVPICRHGNLVSFQVRRLAFLSLVTVSN